MMMMKSGHMQNQIAPSLQKSRICHMMEYSRSHYGTGINNSMNNNDDGDMQILAEIVGATNLRLATTATATTATATVEQRSKKPKEQTHSCEPSQCQEEHDDTETADEQNCMNLDPFVVVTLHQGDKRRVLRRTKRVKGTCNPIFCVEHRCFFILNASSTLMNGSITSYDDDHDTDHTYNNNQDNKVQSPLSSSSPFLLFQVRNKDSYHTSSCSILGQASISVKDVILNKCNQERFELTLHNPTLTSTHNTTTATTSTSTSATSKLSIRFRVATHFDLDFMSSFSSLSKFKPNLSSSIHTTNSNSNNATNRYIPRHFLITEESKKSDFVNQCLNTFNYTFLNSKTDSQGILQRRTKPYPDPLRIKQTEYLSDHQIKHELYQPSTNWIEALPPTSSTLGKLYVEILKCNHLPNMDTGAAVGNFTDAFVTVICEDAMFQTDVIYDELSPIWLPWSQRAFTFHITHASSPLYIGVMDYDAATSHDQIGRIVVNLNQFRSNIVYTLTYALYPASNILEREAKGSITIRLRKEIFDPKALLLSSLTPTPRFHVNMTKSSTLSVANFTCFGTYNEDFYDIKLLRSYVNEILELKRFLFYAVGDACHSLIMWNGQVQVGNLFLPLHSVFAFLTGVYIVERPHLIPGYFFICIAWIMFATMIQRIQHPSPWKRTLPFYYFLSILIYGNDAVMDHDDIPAYQGHEENEKFDDYWSNRILKDFDMSNKIWEIQKEIEQLGNQDLHTKEKKVDYDPLTAVLSSLSDRLFPIQLRLRNYCSILRKIRLIATWEDSMMGFWVTLSSLSIGVALMILPTTRILHVVCRIGVWSLGPWYRMYHELVRDKPHTSKSKEEQMLSDAVASQFKEKNRLARLNGEEASKMKSMRILRFGKHIAKVPGYHVARHYDYPLTSSSALQFDKFQSLHDDHIPRPSRVQISQRLNGTMIPTTEDQVMDTLRQISMKGEGFEIFCNNDDFINDTDVSGLNDSFSIMESFELKEKSPSVSTREYDSHDVKVDGNSLNSLLYDSSSTKTSRVVNIISMSDDLLPIDDLSSTSESYNSDSVFLHDSISSSVEMMIMKNGDDNEDMSCSSRSTMDLWTDRRRSTGSESMKEVGVEIVATLDGQLCYNNGDCIH